MPFFFDGNNLIGQSAGRARKDPATQREFLKLLGHYTTSRGGRFVVFFDGDAASFPLPPPGIRVRFSAPTSSDEAIVDCIVGSRHPSEIIVVTNDHGLSNRCRDAGAKVIDWREFTSRMEKGRPSAKADKSKEDSVDLKEWSRYFGIDPDTLE